MIEYMITFIACLIAGVLTGITGLGGGLVIVPAFLGLRYLGYSDLFMHQIVGVSSAVVFFNSILSLLYRRKDNFLPLRDIFFDAMYVIIGAFFGAYISKYLSEFYLNVVYLFVCLLSVILLIKKLNYDFLDKKYLMYFLFFVSGALSSCVGIGGAAFFALILRAWYKKNTKNVLASVTFFVAINATFAFAGKLYINDVVFYLLPYVIIGGIIGSKLGVEISKRMPSKSIRFVMIAVCIIGMLSVLGDVL